MKKLFLVALVGTLTAIAADAGNDPNADVLSQIAGYRTWTPINGEPVKVEVPKDAEVPNYAPSLLAV